MPTDDSRIAPKSATLTISNLPATGDTLTDAHVLATAAKTWLWCGMDEKGSMPDDAMLLRGALALLHMLATSEAMREAPALAAMLSTAFDPVNDTPTRAKLFGLELEDPSAFLAEAVRTNRRLSGLPPQLEIVPDLDEGAGS